LAHHKVCCKVLQAQKQLNKARIEEDPVDTEIYKSLEVKAIAQSIKKNKGGSGILLPLKYRILYDGIKSKWVVGSFEYALEMILRNNLTLCPSREQPGDYGSWCVDYFLCLELEDEDLPWDLNQRDW